MKYLILKNIYNLIVNFYKLLNSSKPKLLIYTDSRGVNVIGKLYKNPFDSYVGHLIKKYNVDYYLCEEKYTTIVDFLELAQRADFNKYDKVILHCGVVDFSPRPISNIENVKNSKNGNKTFDELYSQNETHYTTYLGPKYLGEELTTLYSKAYLTDFVGPKIQRINNLVWINSNHFVKGWEGNYTKGRPVNIDAVVSAYQEIFKTFTNNCIDISAWTDTEIKKFTIDNIHFNKEGFAQISRLIESELEQPS